MPHIPSHLDLFSGIGGFSYAADQVWDNVEHTFVEIDDFCQAVLRKNFPGATIHGDIRTTSFKNQGYDIITASPPCQAVSHAGKRRGKADDRWLWPEAFRIIREVNPTWCILENVYGLLTLEKGLVFESLLSELEGIGYEAQPFIIPAVAVNAPHRRDRVWIIACNTEYNGQHGAKDTEGSPERGDDNETGSKEVREPKRADSLWNVFETRDWDNNWREVASSTCNVRMDDGFSEGLVQLSDGGTITRAKWRQQAIKAYGNAIVPTVAIEIMKAMREAS